MNEIPILTILIPGLIVFVILIVLFQRSKNLKVTVNEYLKDKVILKIAVPVKNEKGPLAAEQLFQSLHGILRGSSKGSDLYSLEIVATSQGIYFIVVSSERYRQFLENQVYAQYPTAQISIIRDYTESLNNSKGLTISAVELGLSKENYLPIMTFQNFDVDPLASITGSISKLLPGYEVWIQMVVRPVDNSWQDFGKKFVDSKKNMKDSEGNSVGLESGESAQLAEVERKNSKVGFQFNIRILSKGPDPVIVQHNLEDSEASFKQFQTGQFNSLSIKKKESSPIKEMIVGKRLSQKLPIVNQFALRLLDETTDQVLNTEEIASIFHLPNQSVETPNIAWAMSKKLEFPKNLPFDHKQARIFGLTDYRGQHIPFGIKHEDRRRHMYLLGKTGTGKSTLLKTLIAGDILDGKGLAVIDPHGDLIDELIELIPESRINDVVILDPSDKDYPVGLNMLALKPGESEELLADGIVSVFKKYFDSWGPRLQHILTNTIITLLKCQNVSLLAIQRILVDKNYRKFLLKQVKDPFVHKFWEQEFDALAANPRMLTEAVAPIQNKVGRFLSSTMVRNMFGQIKSTIDLQDIMNSGKILLVNLSQGKIGEENSSLLGGMIVTRLYSNAMQRAKMAQSERKDFYLYVDEFQNFATDTFIKILSEARKYGLNLILTHQYIDQLEPEIQSAIFGNVGTVMNYVVGQSDAASLEKEYTPYLESEDLVNLDRYRLAMKLTIDGAQSHPFTAVAIKPNFTHFGLREKIYAASREQYALERTFVEDKLNKWANQSYSDKGNMSKSVEEEAADKKPAYTPKPQTHTPTAQAMPDSRQIPKPQDNKPVQPNPAAPQPSKPVQSPQQNAPIQPKK